MTKVVKNASVLAQLRASGLSSTSDTTEPNHPNTTPKLLTICFLIDKQNNRVLLGLKKKGFGADRWNGFGGKVESNESIINAAKREVSEEVSMFVEEIIHVGTIVFTFDGGTRPLETHMFVSYKFSGIPTESVEMRPKWFDIETVPYDQMWPADKFWVPQVLSGKTVKGKIHFKDDNTVATKELNFF